MKIYLFLLIALLIPIVAAIECQPLMQPSDATNCTITSLWNYTNCSNSHLIVYNTTSLDIVGNFTYYDYVPYCQTLWNITTLGSYTGVVYENGDTVSIEIQGDNHNELGVSIDHAEYVFWNICNTVEPNYWRGWNDGERRKDREMIKINEVKSTNDNKKKTGLFGVGG